MKMRKQNDCWCFKASVSSSWRKVAPFSLSLVLTTVSMTTIKNPGTEEGVCWGLKLYKKLLIGLKLGFSSLSKSRRVLQTDKPSRA